MSDASHAVAVDIRFFYSLSGDVTGFYTWAIFAHKKYMPSSTFRDFRMVFKLRPNVSTSVSVHSHYILPY